MAEEYAIAARVYAEAVVMLTRKAANSHVDYRQLVEATQKAQQRAEAAGTAFEEHLQLHGCGAEQKAADGSR